MTDKASRLDEPERAVICALKGVLDWLGNGSVEVLVGMVGERKLDQETLQHLARRIEETKEEKNGEERRDRRHAGDLR